MSDDKKVIMSEPYKEFENSTSATFPTITFKKYSISMREVILAIIAAVGVIATVALCIALGVTASSGGGSPSPSPSPSPQMDGNFCVNAGCLESAAYVLANVNTTFKPCDDFYNYACGAWSTKNFIPADASQKTVFSKMRDENYERLRAIIESPTTRTTDFAYDRKVKDLFTSCNDLYIKQREGAVPFLTKIVPNVGGWYMTDTSWDPSRFDLTEAMKKVHVDYWTNALFTFYVSPDPHQLNQNVVEIDFSGLGMYWLYYSGTDSNAIRIRQAYRTFITNVANLVMRDANLPIPANDKQIRINTFVDDVMNFETKLANVTLYTVPTDEPHRPNLRKTLAQLNSMANMIDWSRFFMYMFNDGGLTANSKLVLLEHDYLSKVSQMVMNLGEYQNRMTNNYLIWRMLQSYVQDLSWEYVHANREFYVAQTGRPEFLGTWLYCFNQIRRKLPTAFGALYVRDHFSKDDKDTVHTMVSYMKKSLKELLPNAAWMDDTTRNIALAKVDAITDKLGYPDLMAPGNDHKLDDYYAKLTVNKSDFFQNVLSMNLYEKSNWNDRLKNGQDRGVWAYSVYDVASHMYNPWNELLIPAGALQFPLYDKILPMYMNFGSIGTIMSHELMHSIDEVGGYYKKDGTFFDWWTTATTQNYIKARQCIIDYYSNKTVGPYRLPGTTQGVKVPINGKSYAMEGIAETYGVKQAFYAYKKYENDKGFEKMAPGLNLTNDQAFFVTYGQTLCFNRNDAYSYQIAVRGRVPEDMMVNGALAQLEEFKTAFNCPANAKLVASKKCNLF